jgi:hypothetical protein
MQPSCCSCWRSYYGVLSLSLLPSADLVAILQHPPGRISVHPLHLLAYLKGQQWQQHMQPLVPLVRPAEAMMIQHWNDEHAALHQCAAWHISLCITQGIGVFAVGNLLQNQSHRILAALATASRAASDKAAESYRIPYGRLWSYRLGAAVAAADGFAFI